LSDYFALAPATIRSAPRSDETRPRIGHKNRIVRKLSTTRRNCSSLCRMACCFSCYSSGRDRQTPKPSPETSRTTGLKR
jgi:hypothetical protein